VSHTHLQTSSTPAVTNSGFTCKLRWSLKRGTLVRAQQESASLPAGCLQQGWLAPCAQGECHFARPFKLSLAPHCGDGHCVGELQVRVTRATAGGGDVCSAVWRTWRATVHSAAAATARSVCARRLVQSLARPADLVGGWREARRWRILAPIVYERGGGISAAAACFICHILGVCCTVPTHTCLLNGRSGAQRAGAQPAGGAEQRRELAARGTGPCAKAACVRAKHFVAHIAAPRRADRPSGL